MRSVDEVPKRPYQPPTLSIYGNLAEITKSGGSKGMLDMTPGSSMS
jgi:hypothetical protein